MTAQFTNASGQAVTEIPHQFLYFHAGDWAEAGATLVQRIKARTAGGMDYTGAPFAPYSPTYSRVKGTSVPDLRSLRSRAHMMDLLDWRVGQIGPGRSATADASVLEVGIFGDTEAAQRARWMNQGVQGRTRAGYRTLASAKGAWTRAVNRGNRPAKKGYFTIPPRVFLRATYDELREVGDMIKAKVQARFGKEQ